MLKCNNCGRMITFIKRKGQKSIPVEPRAEYFVPDDVAGTVVFVSEKGMVRKGRPATDGIKGYILHKCDRKRVIT